jgi:site-specific DNA recombinase
MPRVAIVTRVSTEEQTRPDYNSCDSQEDICRHYVQIKKDQGWEVYRVYEDAGFSGRNLKRPGIQALLVDVRRDLIDIVLCTRIDRISRSIRDFYSLWTILEKHGVTFVSATEAFDTSTAAGSLMVNLLLSFGAWEVAVVSERTSLKMLARVRRGLWNGGHVPLGYAYIREQQLLVPDAEEAKVVVSLFEALVREGTVAGVRQFANEQRYRSKVRSVTGRSGESREVGGKPISFDLIRQIITNPVYKGCLRYGDELYEGNHDAIVPRDLWDTANALLRQRVRGRRFSDRTADGHVHLFKGLLRCGDCGAAMTPYPSGKRKANGEGAYLYYACLTAVRDRPHCTCRVRSLPARAFEEAVLQTLERLGEDPSLVAKVLQEGSAADQRDVKRLEKRKVQLQDELEGVDERMVRLLAVFEESETVPEGLKTRCCELEEQRAGLRHEILQVQHELDDLGGAAPDPAEVADFLRDFTTEIRDLPLLEKKARIRSVIGRMTLNQTLASGTVFDAGDGPEEGDCRTRGVLVKVHVSNRPAESADSAGLSTECLNQPGVSSAIERLGSAERIRTSDLKVMSPVNLDAPLKWLRMASMGILSRFANSETDEPCEPNFGRSSVITPKPASRFLIGSFGPSILVG